MTERHAEVEVLLGQHGVFRRVPLASLAAVTQVPLTTLRESCSRLLLSLLTGDDTDAPHRLGEPTEGVGTKRTERLEPDESQKEIKRNEPNEPTPKRNEPEGVGLGEGGATALDAMTLATLLDDLPRRRTYEAIVARHTPEDIAHALSITLARPPGTIRTTRGAYFNGLVGTFAARGGAANATQYARSSPPAS